MVGDFRIRSCRSVSIGRAISLRLLASLVYILSPEPETSVLYKLFVNDSS